MQDHEFWTWIFNALNAGTDVCLITMVDASGKGPNRPGSRLAVTADGKRFGTVGGGNSEFMLVETAAEMVAEKQRPVSRLVTLDHGDSESSQDSGMICSGSQVFALLCLTPLDIPTILQIARAWSDGPPGKISLSADGLVFSETSQHGPLISFDSEVWCYEEIAGLFDTVTLVGGGHVSLALSPLLAILGLRIIVLDNRPDLDTMKANRFAHVLDVVDYENITPHILAGNHSYVCIMTFGHQHDELVLKQLVEINLRYLGMMGSAQKINTIFEHLLADGVPREVLSRVHAPIGLPIGSNTPEEIAISIAAQIIGVHRGVLGSELP